MAVNTLNTSLTGEPQDVPGTTGPDTSLPTGPQQGSNKTRKKGWKRPDVALLNKTRIYSRRGSKSNHWKGGISLDRKKWDREKRRKHPISIKESQRKYKESEHGKKKHREWYLMKKYGITIEQYNESLLKQNFSCGVCKRHQSLLNKILPFSKFTLNTVLDTFLVAFLVISNFIIVLFIV